MLRSVWLMINRYALRALREKDGQTRAQLAAKAGLSPQYYGEIERGARGKAASPPLVKSIASALDVPMSAITCAHQSAENAQETAA